MSDWIDYVIYVTFIASFLILLPKQMSAWNRMVLADRNAAWLAAHPEAPTHYNGSRVHLWVARAIGAAAIAAMTAFQLGLLSPFGPRANGHTPFDWQVLWDIASTASLAGTCWLVGGLVLFGARCLNKVPLAEQRRATLEPRSMEGLVSLPVRVATYGAVVATLVAWLVVGAMHRYSSPIFWPRVAILLFLSAFFFFMTRLMANRRPNSFDAAFGPAIRRSEVRTGFALQWTIPVIGGVRLYEELTNTLALDASRLIQLVLAAFLAWGFLQWLAWTPKPQDPNSSPGKSSRPARSDPQEV